MNILKLRPWLIAASLVVPCAVAIGLTSSPVQAGDDDDDDDDDDDSCDPDDVDIGPSALPDGFDGFMVFMANGELDPNTGLLVNDLSFFTDVMGFDQDDIDDFIDDRLDRIESKFGIVDPMNNPDVVVLVGTTNSALNYTAYVMGDEAVPSSGWEVREGSVVVRVINPAGLELGGEFAGQNLGPGGFVAGGIYNVEVTDECGVPTGEEIVIDFSSSAPIELGGPIGAQFQFLCQIWSFDFPGASPGQPARGLAQGISDPKLIPGTNLAKFNVRNTLTFSSDPSLGSDFDGL